MKIARLLTEHPASVGETYTEHMGHAASFGARMVVSGLACLVHAVLPFWFVNTGSDGVSELHSEMGARRDRRLEKDGLAGAEASTGTTRKAVES